MVKIEQKMVKVVFEFPQRNTEVQTISLYFCSKMANINPGSLNSEPNLNNKILIEDLHLKTANFDMAFHWSIRFTDPPIRSRPLIQVYSIKGRTL